MKVADFAVDFGISKAELNGLLRRIVRHNYLKEVIPKEELIMTDFGKVQGIILKSWKEACERKNVVLVSHRKSTMNVADVVWEMESGRIS